MITITHTTGIPIVECDHEDITLADYMCTIGYAPPRYPLPSTITQHYVIETRTMPETNLLVLWFLDGMLVV